jgi:hypothetical protein
MVTLKTSLLGNPLTQLFNAILLLNYFPTQWNVTQIILILKPGKPPHDLSSYRPISLLPVISKLFEKLLLKRLLAPIEHNKLITPHQFHFRRRLTGLTKPSNTRHTAPLHSLISLKPLTSITDFCTS